MGRGARAVLGGIPDWGRGAEGGQARVRPSLDRASSVALGSLFVVIGLRLMDKIGMRHALVLFFLGEPLRGRRGGLEASNGGEGETGFLKTPSGRSYL